MRLERSRPAEVWKVGTHLHSYTHVPCASVIYLSGARLSLHEWARLPTSWVAHPLLLFSHPSCLLLQFSVLNLARTMTAAPLFRFYPVSVKSAEQRLSHYSSFFSCVEVFQPPNTQHAAPEEVHQTQTDPCKSKRRSTLPRMPSRLQHVYEPSFKLPCGPPKPIRCSLSLFVRRCSCIQRKIKDDW